jgi:hypothetical protein
MKKGDTPQPKESDVDSVSMEEGVHAITSSLKPTERGGWVGKKENSLLTLIPGHFDKNGVRIITYSLEPPPQHRWSGAYDPSFFLPMDDTERSIISHTQKEIEQACNIKFQLQEPGDPQEADIYYCKTPLEKGSSGNANDGFKVISLAAPGVDLVVSETGQTETIENKAHQSGINPKTILHETLHTLGLSHPGANGLGGYVCGENPKFSEDSTIMSYFEGIIKTVGLAAFDVAALQCCYGKPVGENAVIPEINLISLTHCHYIYSPTPTTLDLRSKLNDSGDLTIGDGKISGTLNLEGVEEPKRVKIRTIDEPFANIIAGNIAIHAKGNNLRNHFEGSSKDDELTAVGGLDVLTGNKGADTFKIGKESRIGNYITDFNPAQKDVIQLDDSIARVELRYNDGIFLEGKLTPSTEIWALDKNNTPVASVQVLDTTPIQLQKHLRYHSIGQHVTVDIIADAPPVENVTKLTEGVFGHPSGLPENLGWRAPRNRVK